MTTTTTSVNDYDRRHLAAHPPIAQQRQKRAGTLLLALGRRWGWIDSRDDRQMHLRTLDLNEPPVRVELEEKGARAFHVTGLLDLDEYATIKKEVEASRRAIERSWVAHMIERGWIEAAVANDHVFIVANPGTENAFRRVVDLRGLGVERLDEPEPRVRYDLEGASVVVEGYAAEPLNVSLSKVLFRDGWASDGP